MKLTPEIQSQIDQSRRSNAVRATKTFQETRQRITAKYVASLTVEQLADLRQRTTFADENAKHSYDVQIGVGHTIRIEAYNRNVAATLARNIGHTVMSVNMVG